MQSKFTLRRSFSKPIKYAVHSPCFEQTKFPISKRSDFSPCDNIWTGIHSNFLSAIYFAAVTILFYNTSIVFRLLTDETTLSLHPGDVETGAQSITVQTFPNPLSKLEDTVLASLTVTIKSNVKHCRRNKLFPEPGVPPFSVARGLLILVVKERQHNLLNITKTWHLHILVIFGLPCFNIL